MNEGPRYNHGFDQLLFVCRMGDWDILAGRRTGKLFATDHHQRVPFSVSAFNFPTLPDEVKDFMLAHEALRL